MLESTNFLDSADLKTWCVTWCILLQNLLWWKIDGMQVNHCVDQAFLESAVDVALEMV